MPSWHHTCESALDGPRPCGHHTHGIAHGCPRPCGTTLVASVALALSASHSWLRPCGYGGPRPHHTRGSALLRPFWCLPSWRHIWEFALGGPRPRSRCCPQQCRRGQCSHVSLVDAVIGCRRCMPRSRACRRRSTRRGVPLAALAAVVSMPSLSSAVDVTQPTRVRTAAWCGLLLTALAAVVGYTVVGCRVGLAIALISCRRCSHRWRA